MDQGSAGLSRRGFLGAAMASPLVAGLRPGLAEAAPEGVDNRMRTDRQWAEFLAGQDLRWSRMPRTWHEGPFLGNGFLATGGYGPIERDMSNGSYKPKDGKPLVLTDGGDGGSYDRGGFTNPVLSCHL